MIRSNSDTDFFKDKRFIDNINNNIEKVDDISTSKNKRRFTMSVKETERNFRFNDSQSNS